ncbi:MAG: hypothetical protein R2731_02680 [Nocardioides sp.]
MALREVLRPGGTLSLLVAQRHAAVIARAMAGHFTQARTLLEGGDPEGRAGHRFTREQLTALVSAAGLAVTDVHAVRVFADLVPGSRCSTSSRVRPRRWLSSKQAVADRPEYLPRHPAAPARPPLTRAAGTPSPTRPAGRRAGRPRRGERDA